jgi:hypothetical protein
MPVAVKMKIVQVNRVSNARNAMSICAAANTKIALTAITKNNFIVILIKEINII